MELQREGWLDGVLRKTVEGKRWLTITTGAKRKLREALSSAIFCHITA
ncbi:hypothetical protein GME_13130 [Halomonas sp. TD01]|nr:hypothetical protein GME_13130 [Halomonas sp. TD01]